MAWPPNLARNDQIGAPVPNISAFRVLAGCIPPYRRLTGDPTRFSTGRCPGDVLHDGRLVEKHDGRRRRILVLPCANDAFSLGEVDGLRLAEFIQHPIIKVEDSDERTGVTAGPRGIEPD